MCNTCIKGYIPDPESTIVIYLAFLFCIVEVKNWCATNGIPTFNPGKAIFGFKYNEATRNKLISFLILRGLYG